MNVEKKLNSLKEYIKSKSEVEAEKLIKDAEERVKEINENYEKRAAQAYSDIVEKAKRDVAIFERREEAQTLAKSSRMILDAKNEIVNSAVEELKESVYSLNQSEKYALLFEKLLTEAVESLDENEITLQVRDEDKELALKVASKIEKKFGKKLSVLNESAPIRGGVIAASKDRRVVVENTLENKFEEMKESFLSRMFSELNTDG